MEDYQLDPTKKSPLIDFSASGKLVLAGSSYSENAREFYDPIIEWIDKLEAPKIDFDLIIEYINTSCAKKLFELLKSINQNEHISQIDINWYYHKWDEDNLETGQILSESFPKMNFSYIEYDKKD
jgi:hypothetical protein